MIEAALWIIPGVVRHSLKVKLFNPKMPSLWRGCVSEAGFVRGLLLVDCERMERIQSRLWLPEEHR